MDAKMWINKDMDLIETMKTKEYEIVVKYSCDNQQNIFANWGTKDVLFLQKMLRFGISTLRYFEKHLQDSLKMRAVFRLGALMGTIESFEQLLYEKKQDDRSVRLYQEQILSIKHLDEIILTLEMHGKMTHTEICESLHLNESTLSEIMKKIDFTQLITSSKFGKYKLYMLTDEGRRVGKQLRKQHNASIDEEELLERLGVCLSHADNRDKLIHNICQIIEIDNKKTGRENFISPGDSLAVYYKERGETKHDDYRVFGMENSGRLPYSTKRVIAEKLDVNNITNDYQFEYGEELEA